MAKDLLFEIGMEEIPARFIRNAMMQLQEKMAKWLQEARIEFNEINAYATPRRIAVLVRSVAAKQADIQEEAKGPSKKIALDENGEWSKAALGFARSQGVEPGVLVLREHAGAEYVFASKNSAGVETAALLSEGLSSIVSSMTFPKTMRWGSYDLKFVRPIRWMVALFGEEIISLEIADVRAGRVSKGHRFLGKDVELSAPSDYVDLLRSQFVYADVKEREQLIEQQINDLAQQKQWNISIKEDLLEEVLFLVEYPTVLYGTFNPEFLHIPQEVLITSMREHQRYFPVLDQEGNLLPYFVTVRNGNSLSLEQVAKGNEKVLRARLSDAKFFYEEDQKLSIDTALARLETIVFHEELGTVGDKVRRIRKIAKELGKILKVSKEDADLVERSAAICKFDLVMQMVYEFPELQGVMGEDYARKAGEKEQVAHAVLEHYQPRFSGDASPMSIVGSIISIADKIDTIAGCFSIGIIPTGSQDPYALRRQSAGIVQILFEHKLACTLTQLIDAAIQTHEKAGMLKRNADEIRKEIMDFFALRVKNVFPHPIRYDVIDAVMAAGFDDVASVVNRGTALMNRVLQQDFKATVDSFTRVNNLAFKAKSEDVDTSVFAEQEEHDLYVKWQHMHETYTKLMRNADQDEALAALSELKEPITRFFDAVMVMAEDEQVREARLGLLNLISTDLKRYADFQKIVWA